MGIGAKVGWSILVVVVGVIAFGLFQDIVGRGQYFLTGVEALILIYIWTRPSRSYPSLREGAAVAVTKQPRSDRQSSETLGAETPRQTDMTNLRDQDMALLQAVRASVESSSWYFEHGIITTRDFCKELERRGRRKGIIDLPLKDSDRQRLLKTLPDTERERLERIYSSPSSPSSEPGSEGASAGLRTPEPEKLHIRDEPADHSQPQSIQTEPGSAAQSKPSVSEEGSSEVQFALGRSFQEGSNGSKDDQRAASLFTSAANKGHALAQLHLGRLLLEGRGVPQDFEMAYFWLNLAAAQLGGDDVEAAIQERGRAADLLSPAELLKMQRACRKWRGSKHFDDQTHNEAPDESPGEDERHAAPPGPGEKTD